MEIDIGLNPLFWRTATIDTVKLSDGVLNMPQFIIKEVIDFLPKARCCCTVPLPKLFSHNQSTTIIIHCSCKISEADAIVTIDQYGHRAIII